MDALILVALLGVPALAAQYQGPRDANGRLTLPPLLLGRAQDPASPLWKGLDAQASRLLERRSGGALPEAAVARDLSAAAALREDPVARASALALAAAVTERDLRAAAPGLPEPVRRLADALQAGSPYRGDAPPGGTDLRALAREALSDRRLMSAFDGRASSRDLALSGLYFKDGYLVVPNGKAAGPLRRGAFSSLYAHPEVEGALVERYAPPVEIPVFNSWSLREAEASRIAARQSEPSRALALAGAGPRHFGVDHLAEGRIRPLTHAVAVRERVYGESVDRLIREGRFGEEEYALVDALLARLARARLEPGAFDLKSVKIGRTAADPRPAAYLLEREPLRALAADASEESLREGLGQRTVRDPLLPVYEDGAYGGVRRGMVPLETLLRSGVERSRRGGLKERLSRGLADAIEELGRLKLR